MRPDVFESAKKTPRPIIGEVVSRVSDGEIQGGLEGVQQPVSRVPGPANGIRILRVGLGDQSVAPAL